MGYDQSSHSEIKQKKEEGEMHKLKKRVAHAVVPVNFTL